MEPASASENLFLLDKAHNHERASTRSGSQSQRRIWFNLPAHIIEPYNKVTEHYHFAQHNLAHAHALKLFYCILHYITLQIAMGKVK